MKHRLTHCLINCIFMSMRAYIATIFLCCQLVAYSQTTITQTITHQGEDRSYIIYIPASYTADQAVPLVLNFHGYGSTAVQQMNYGDFRTVADTAGFIIVHPQGAVFEGSTHWNIGSWVDGSPYDDVAFTEAILDQVVAEYSIDADRVYSTGMSNGGYMSFLLACQLSDRIAAIASVTGSMSPNNFLDCSPERPVPVMQIHGTADGIVPYEGAFWTKSVADVVSYWVEHNNCDQAPISLELPDLNTGDGSTASFFRYDNGDEGAVVEHIRINGGDHTWPGASFVTPGTNLDFSASEAIWQFFQRYDLEGLVTAVADSNAEDNDIAIHVDVQSQQLHVIGRLTANTPYHIYTTEGQQVNAGTLGEQSAIIDVSYLSIGTYVLSVAGRSHPFVVLP